MNLRTKKNIAKEVLYLFAGVILLLMFWLYLEIKNNYHHNKIVTYKEEIAQLQSQIKKLESKPLLEPDKLKKLNENAKMMSESGSSKDDILAMKDDFLKKFGNQNTLNEQVKLKTNEVIINDKIKKANLKMLNREEIFHNIKLLSIVLFIFLYPVRISFILVKWAIKILKIEN